MRMKGLQQQPVSLPLIYPHAVWLTCLMKWQNAAWLKLHLKQQTIAILQGGWEICKLTALTNHLKDLPVMSWAMPLCKRQEAARPQVRVPGLEWTGGNRRLCVCVCVHAQLCSTPCNPVDGSPPDSSVHGISQAKILKLVAISFSRGSSSPRDRTCVSCIGRQILYHWAASGKPTCYVIDV